MMSDNVNVLLQMVVVMKKLTYGALLSPSDASEEFREGIIKCFRSLISSLIPCSDESCSCKQTFYLPMLLDSRDLKTMPVRSAKCDSEPGECLVAFLQSQASSAAVGHWLSLLLKVREITLANNCLTCKHNFFLFCYFLVVLCKRLQTLRLHEDTEEAQSCVLKPLCPYVCLLPR